jgi:hypothetical protein
VCRVGKGTKLFQARVDTVPLATVRSLVLKLPKTLEPYVLVGLDCRRRATEV